MKLLFYLFTKFYIHCYKCHVVMHDINFKTSNLLLDFASMIEVDLPLIKEMKKNDTF